MKLREFGTIIVFTVIGLFVLGGIVSHYFWRHDNAYEEFVEKMLFEQTGVEMDFSPQTPENKT